MKTITETIKIKHFEIQRFTDEKGKEGAELVGITEDGSEIRLENYVSIGQIGDYCKVITDIICTEKTN